MCRNLFKASLNFNMITLVLQVLQIFYFKDFIFNICMINIKDKEIIKIILFFD